jgi:glucosamine-6-phosphate deaminase
MKVEWDRVNAFHMDEYIGLDPDAPQGFGNFLRERLFSRVRMKETFLLDGNAKDVAAECRRYAALLEEFPADLVVLGIGENTHLAFNDPHVARFDDPALVKVVELDEVSRRQQVNDGCFLSIEDVPTQALTLTIPALMRAPFIFAVVPGRRKAEAVRRTLREEIGERWPSTVLRGHPGAVLFIDQESAGDPRGGGVSGEGSAGDPRGGGVSGEGSAGDWGAGGFIGQANEGDRRGGG